MDVLMHSGRGRAFKAEGMASAEDGATGNKAEEKKTRNSGQSEGVFLGPVLYANWGNHQGLEYASSTCEVQTIINRNVQPLLREMAGRETRGQLGRNITERYHDLAHGTYAITILAHFISATCNKYALPACCV